MKVRLSGQSHRELFTNVFYQGVWQQCCHLLGKVPVGCLLLRGRSDEARRCQRQIMYNLEAIQ